MNGERQETRARLASPGDWGRHGSSTSHVRYAKEYKRRPGGQPRCHCGCKSTVTHLGMANGVCLTSGCELYVRRWVRNG